MPPSAHPNLPAIDEDVAFNLEGIGSIEVVEDGAIICGPYSWDDARQNMEFEKCSGSSLADEDDTDAEGVEVSPEFMSFLDSLWYGCVSRKEVREQTRVVRTHIP
jgi:hypothetical protein